MRRRARRADELDTARRLLGSAEREALDEVIAIRAEATGMLEAARREAARLRAEAIDERARSRKDAEDVRAELVLAQTELDTDRAELDADRERLQADEAKLRFERAAMDAVREELQTLRDDLDEQTRAGAGDPSQRAGPSPSAAGLLASTQADLAALVQLLDGLASRAGSSDLDHSETGGEL